MPKRKAAFFDIDGTLLDAQNRIIPSGREAVRRLRKNGCLAFLCSGRSKAFIRNPRLLEIGFDGIVSAGGTMVEYRNETIFYKRIENSLMAHTIKTVRSYGFRPILEGKEYLYMDEDEFGKDPFGERLMSEIGDHILSISGEWGRWEVSKLSCATDHADQKGCLAALKDEYDFQIHNADVVEMVPKGYHKGTGILKVCEFLNLDAADTYAFGDSVNDLGMFETAGTAIAMGNGSRKAKEAADYVTASLHEDGIWKACEHFGLL